MEPHQREGPVLSNYVKQRICILLCFDFVFCALSKGIKKAGRGDLEVELIKLTKCNTDQAEAMTQELKDLGLEYHYLEDEGVDHDFDWYDLKDFAKMRGWFD